MRHSLKVLCLILAALWLGQALPAAAAPAEAPLVSKRQGTSPHVTVYSVSGPQCELAWEVRRFGDGQRFGFSEHAHCMLALPQQDPYRSALLKALVADTDGLRGLRNFFWGRLLRGDASDALAANLTKAAAQSPHWDAAAGTVKQYTGSTNRFIGGLMNDARVFSDVESSFARFGYSLKVNGVEKVVVKALADNASGLPVGRYPVDCLVSFEVIRKPLNSP